MLFWAQCNPIGVGELPLDQWETGDNLWPQETSGPQHGQDFLTAQTSYLYFFVYFTFLEKLTKPNKVVTSSIVQ